MDPTKNIRKVYLNVCQLLLLTNTFSDFVYLFAVLIKICSFLMYF